jgi:hypothetical protein
MTPETEIKLYELAFGINARPEHLNDSKEDIKSSSYTEDDLLEAFKEFEEQSNAFDVMRTALQENTSFDINTGVSD